MEVRILDCTTIYHLCIYILYINRYINYTLYIIYYILYTYKTWLDWRWFDKFNGTFVLIEVLLIQLDDWHATVLVQAFYCHPGIFEYCHELNIVYRDLKPVPCLPWKCADIGTSLSFPHLHFVEDHDIQATIRGQLSWQIVGRIMKWARWCFVCSHSHITLYQ